MEIIQKEIILKPKTRGFHLVTNEILDKLYEIQNIKTGLITFNIKHTSASLCLNECADREVRTDMEKFFNKCVPENLPFFDHTYEGSDDMPAHIKSVLVGTTITVPITNGALNLGTWQGIYLGEHRNNGGLRRIVATIMG